MTAPATTAKGVISLPVTVSADDAAHLAGNPVPINSVWAEINGTKFWSQDVNAAGVGANYYSGNVALDTTKYPDGYYDVVTRAASKSGSQGYNNGSGVYNYDASQRLLIVNAPANKIAPLVTSVTVTTGSPAQTATQTPAAPYYVRRYLNYVWNMNIQSRNPLLSVKLAAARLQWEFSAVPLLQSGVPQRQIHRKRRSRLHVQRWADAL